MITFPPCPAGLQPEDEPDFMTVDLNIGLIPEGEAGMERAEQEIRHPEAHVHGYHQWPAMKWIPPVGIVLLMAVTGSFAFYTASHVFSAFWQAVLFAFVVAATLLYEYLNGSHDAANSTAAIIRTHVLKPEQAGILFAVMNTFGAVTNTAVAATIGHEIIGAGKLPLAGLIGALLGGSLWSFVSLRLGRPTSSSHTLLSSLIGATVALGGAASVQWNHVLDKIVIPMLLAIPIALLASMLCAVLIKQIRRHWMKKSVDHHVMEPNSIRSRLVQIFMSSWLAFSHGSNDGQKGMGVIALGLGMMSATHTLPWWVIYSCAIAMGLGTLAGGFEVLKRLGHLFDRNANARDGANAQGVSAAVISLATFWGIPLSTTQVTSMSNLGTSLGKLLDLEHFRTARRLSGVLTHDGLPVHNAWVAQVFGPDFQEHLTQLAIHLKKIANGWLATIPLSMAAGAGMTWIIHLLLRQIF